MKPRDLVSERLSGFLASSIKTKELEVVFLNLKGPISLETDLLDKLHGWCIHVDIQDVD